MLKVQHIGIPTADFDKTIEWYITRGFNVIYQTILDDNINVAFIDIFGVILEFYVENITHTENPVINQIVINTKDQNKILISPTGEKIILQVSNYVGLDHIVINTTSISKTSNDLKKHGFKKTGSFYINGQVRFILALIKEKEIKTGIINHIAFDEDDIHRRFIEITGNKIPVVEGINFLPFFKNGVEYFVTENFNGLRLEYNQIIRHGEL